MFELFPNLKERLDNRGNQLSGGEQQMLSIARALLTNPSVLLMDEPTEGLAPVIVEALTAVLIKLRSESGLSIILVEQNSRVAFEFSDRSVVLDKGRIVYDGASAALRDDPERLAKIIGVSEYPCTIARRRFLQLAALAALPGWPHMAPAQDYPSKPVRFVVGFPAGGPNDILGRIVAQWLSQKLGQPFNVENKGGQSGNIATAEVVRAPADGYTILLGGPANAISGSLYPNLELQLPARHRAGRRRHPRAAGDGGASLGAGEDRAGVPRPCEGQSRRRSRWRRPASAARRTSPANCSSRWPGSQLPVVHYGGGGPALKAMIAGEAQMMFEPMSASIGPVRSGKLRALAVTTTERSAALPEVPTIAETVPGFEASAVTGIGVPKGTPAEIVETLNKAVQAAFADAGDEGKARRHRRRAAAGHGGGVRQADGGGDREVGQGGEGGGDQGGVSRSPSPPGLIEG